MRRAGLWLIVLVLLSAALWLWRDSAQPLAVGLSQPKSDSSRVDARVPLLEAQGAPSDSSPAQVAPPERIASVQLPAEAGTYTIKGTVVHEGTGGPVAGGRVIARAAQYTLVRLAADKMTSVKHESAEWSAEVDRGGHFSMKITGAPPPSISDIAYLGAGLLLKHWVIPGKEDQGYTDVNLGGTSTIRLTVEGAFRLQGQVVDPRGRPIESVPLSFGIQKRMGSQREVRAQRMKTGAEGRFDVGPFPTSPPKGLEGRNYFLQVTFEQPGYAIKRLNPWKIPESERQRVRVVMDPGATLAGVLVDPTGRALPGVVIAFEVGEDWKTRRAVRTDDAGLWRLERVPRERVHVRALAFSYGCKVSHDVDVGDDDLGMELVATRIPRPDPAKVKQVLGLSLVDVDDVLRKAYELPDDVNVLILEAREGHEHLGIGTLEPGYGLWMVGNTGVKDLKEAVDRLLALSAKNEKQPYPPARARVVYTFANERMRGTNTQHLQLTEEQREDLLRLQDELRR